jgi:hypothetical protein
MTIADGGQRLRIAWLFSVIAGLPPARGAMDRRHRTVLNDARERGAMFVLQKQPLPWRFTIQKSVRAARVETKNPIPNGPKRHAADLGRLAAS